MARNPKNLNPNTLKHNIPQLLSSPSICRLCESPRAVQAQGAIKGWFVFG